METARFYVVPAGTTDVFAAGFDGNGFDTEQAAEEAIESLQDLGGEFDVAWEIVER